MPTIDEANENIIFRTSKGERLVSDIIPLQGERFWLPVDDGKYVAFVGSETSGYFIKLYSMSEN